MLEFINLKRILTVLAGFLIICGSFQLAVATDPVVPHEQSVKAVFLYNFAKFVQWPDMAFGGSKSPFKIAVVGDVDFWPALSRIENKTIHSRRIVINQLEAVSGLDDYHLVFLSRTLGERINQILLQLDGRPVLTISDVNDFSRVGGIIHLYEKDQKIRFNVNMEKAGRNQLKISSKLLKLAQLVERQAVEKTVDENTR